MSGYLLCLILVGRIISSIRSIGMKQLLARFIFLVCGFLSTNAFADLCDKTNLLTFVTYTKSTTCTGTTNCSGTVCTTCDLVLEPFSNSLVSGVDACFRQTVTDSSIPETTVNDGCGGVFIAVCAI